MASVQKLVDKLIEFGVEYSFQVVGAVIVLVAGIIIGKWVAGLVSRLLGKLMQKADLDPTLADFLAKLAYFMVLAFVIIAAVDKLGVNGHFEPRKIFLVFFGFLWFHYPHYGLKSRKKI